MDLLLLMQKISADIKEQSEEYDIQEGEVEITIALERVDHGRSIDQLMRNGTPLKTYNDSWQTNNSGYYCIVDGFRFNIKGKPPRQDRAMFKPDNHFF